MTQQHTQIRGLYEQGLTIPAIAAGLGISKATVNRRLTELRAQGVKPRLPPLSSDLSYLERREAARLKQAGWKTRAIAKHFSCPEHAMADILRMTPPPRPVPAPRPAAEPVDAIPTDTPDPLYGWACAVRREHPSMRAADCIAEAKRRLQKRRAA
ncbi:winged helix-turn-helix transcriptional regulator [Rhodovarius lipocyclicus]|uniref:winged helix-turn-helix transcriptional regulator n=1 Tax=Rhodovarius lipocyclicus TaxID=268410 RepID=UPI001356DD28|nr:winged helix-turn-helix transcriptional regulator [Rhodovarius lipocyclicus]